MKERVFKIRIARLIGLALLSLVSLVAFEILSYFPPTLPMANSFPILQSMVEINAAIIGFNAVIYSVVVAFNSNKWAGKDLILSSFTLGVSVISSLVSMFQSLILSANVTQLGLLSSKLSEPLFFMTFGILSFLFGLSQGLDNVIWIRLFRRKAG